MTKKQRSKLQTAATTRGAIDELLRRADRVLSECSRQQIDVLRVLEREVKRSAQQQQQQAEQQRGRNNG